MATYSTSMAHKGRVLACAAAILAAVTSPAFAGDVTQDECKGIRVTIGEVVRTVGKDKLSLEFRQSLVDWMGPEITCDGPKDIIIATHQDSVTYGTIRGMLLAGSKPISLQKAGLRVIVREKTGAIVPPEQRRG